MSDKHYVLDYYVFVSRRGDPPNPWVWEIRRKSNPNGRYFWAEGFRSARAAEEAAKSAKRRLKMIERMEMAVARIIRHTPQRRSELARIAAYARAKALSRERRSEIGRKGGAASKGKPKIKKHHRAPTDS
jgi:general stress protein YciG